MRIFAAVVPSDHALADLGDFLDPRRDAGPELRWTDASLWHITLAFMADVPERRLDEVALAVAEAAAHNAPFTARLHTGGAFPHAAEARVLWLGVDGESAALESLDALARNVRLSCAHIGATPEGGGFAPHLTVARARHPFEATRWLRVLDAYSGPEWVADEITLFASHAPSGGRPRQYRAVAAMPLGGEG
ncbi:MAG: RNA 2',3'-cyclic phosphodiesterase [Pedococcus sp.]